MAQVDVEAGEVDDVQRDGAGLQDQLKRLTIDNTKASPEGFMAQNELTQGGLECGKIEGALEAHGPRHVVSSAARVQLLQEP